MNNLKNMQSSQRGFTMIELIVVIVILGILAAVALPRFTNVQRDARIAKLNAARGAVLAAAGMVHGAVLARSGVPDTIACVGGNPGIANNAANGTVCTENGRITLTNFYPRANSAGIINAAGLSPSTWNPTNAQLTQEAGYGFAGAGAGVIAIRVTGGTNAATCFFTYTQAAVGGAPQVGSTNPPSPNGDTTGC